MSSIQIFALHSPYGLMAAVAALEAGLLGDAERRILVPMNTAHVPETAIDLATAPRFTRLRARFDTVEPLNPLVDPRHPTTWDPDPQDLPMIERMLRRAWNLGDAPVELFVQSPQVAPARTLMALFADARLGVIGDGLMTYAPIRSLLPRQITERVTRVVYPDVVAGVSPLVFVETGAERVPVPAATFGTVLREVGEARSDPALDALAAGSERTALVIGQYLAALGLVTPAEEAEMQARMIDRAADAGAERVVVKPHPSAPPSLVGDLAARATARGLRFDAYTGDQPAEFVALRLGATDVIAGFSTALPTIRAIAGTAVHAVGTAEVLAGLTSYENSNRMPATIVDAMNRSEWDGRLQQLVDAVGYAMQPEIVAHLRPRAVRTLAALPPSERERYVPPARLRTLDLPGAPERTRLQRLLLPRGGVGRIEELRLTVVGAKRRAGRVWKAASGR
ncbi:alpha-2,8-polysialyltransferase family protein [Microbacterium esteraromaticum]|uniref:alpha-2,8-polysialyltransferase family protein n=1 Tax=Microbacterium esteraromaticum TaxID=57043 RepID=UPI001CD7BFA4|nr:alpha-2,8-polysialyltransferase family protein [Microbacterium esteraromaticum]MCA1307157.1 alpha-2,8-polysialyltransferase family protein [Microbacterium esteraromaticum]